MLPEADLAAHDPVVDAPRVLPGTPRTGTSGSWGRTMAERLWMRASVGHGHSWGSGQLDPARAEIVVSGDSGGGGHSARAPGEVLAAVDAGVVGGGAPLATPPSDQTFRGGS